MALATQCPHCHTTFRVAQDQLKLRAGLVRCGNCKQIFNGIEHLLPPEGSAKPSLPPEAPAPIENPPTGNAPLPSHIEDAPAPTPAPTSEDSPSSTTGSPDDPLLRMTLINVSPSHDAFAEPEPSPSYDPDAPDPLAKTIDELSRKPLRGSKKNRQDEDESVPGDRIDAEDTEEDEPDFVVKGRRRLRIGRALQMVMRIGTTILLICLLFQATYVFRNQIAARIPATKPALAAMCNTLGCQVGLPVQIESISLESSELQALPDKNAFVFNALLRNNRATALAWPDIELTVNDDDEKPVARRVFTPRDYLHTQDAGGGFAANSEQPVKLFLALSPLKASGYRVYLFYP
jgi:predicted Zn finger-like uncharacterized protein